MGNAGWLERELDQIYIGNMKLYVNIPRYQRYELEPNKASRRENRTLHKEIPKDTRKRVQEVSVEKKGNKSYADIVKGESQQKWKGPVIKTQHHVLSWMVNSVIGQFKIDMNFAQLEEEFVKGGMNMIKVRYLGDNLALLTPRDGESMEDLLKLNKEWFESFFEIIDPWSEDYVAGHKIVWVRCYGLSITFWNKDCFSKVVGEVAELVAIDNSTLLWRTLNTLDFKFVH